MLNFLLRRRIAAFEANYDYNMDYAREILAATGDETQWPPIAAHS